MRSVIKLSRTGCWSRPGGPGWPGCWVRAWAGIRWVPGMVRHGCKGDINMGKVVFAGLRGRDMGEKDLVGNGYR